MTELWQGENGFGKRGFLDAKVVASYRNAKTYKCKMHNFCSGLELVKMVFEDFAALLPEQKLAELR